MKKFLRILSAIVLLLIIAFLALRKKDIPLDELKAKYCNAESKFIEIDSMQVHYRIEGEGRPIVLIPGTGSCLQTWDGWTDSLKKYYKVIRLDMPAFGITGPRKDRDYSIQKYVAFLDEFLSKLGVDSFALAGNSLGGQIAWNYAATYPGKVTQLILVDPGGFYSEKKKNKYSVFALAQHKWLAYLIGQMDTRILVKRTLDDVYYDHSKIGPNTLEMYHDMSLRAGNRQAFTDRVQLIGKEKQADLTAIRAKTLLMWGWQDKLIDIELAGNFKGIPGIKTVIYNKVGHSPQEEIPQKSVADAMDFMRAQ